MNKFDLNAARLISINIIICLIFIIVVWKAYDYLPEKNLNSEFNPTKSNSEELVEDTNREIEIISADKETEINKDKDSKKLEELEIVEFESSTHPNEDLIENYKTALALAYDAETKALCYENIASLYAYQKRYGSALSAAQRAFNMSPDSYREVLLAKLYYKTGNAAEANARLNNVLKRDFELRWLQNYYT